METLNIYQDSLDQVLTSLVESGVLTENQRLLIYLDLAQKLKTTLVKERP